MGLTLDDTRTIKVLLHQAKGLETTILGILNDNSAEHGRYSSYKDMAAIYNDIAIEAKKVIKNGMFYTFSLEEMPGWADTVWSSAKRYMETVLVSTT